MIKKRLTIFLLSLMALSHYALASPMGAVKSEPNSGNTFISSYQDTVTTKKSTGGISSKSFTPLSDSTSVQNQDTTKQQDMKGTFKDKITDRSILDILSVPISNKIFSWKLNNDYLEYDQVAIDTALWLNQLFYPQQEGNESYTFLGNLGSPSVNDHFFSRSNTSKFLFTRYYNAYGGSVQEVPQYNVRSPFTELFYASAGKRSEAEQVFKVMHTQNVNKHINIGITYNHWGTKGVYQHQETRNNLISVFGSYHKGNLLGQAAFVTRVYRNMENGGSENYKYVNDSIESKLIPVWLSDAQSISRESSFFAMGGYTLLNIRELKRDTAKVDKYIPLINAKLLVSREQHSRSFTDIASSSGYFDNFYISNSSTYDTLSQVKWDVKALFEINQFASIPGMPGLRGWIGYENINCFMFTPDDYIYTKEDNRFYSAHLGVAAFSQSPFFSYRGVARVYFSGDKADDKELKGEVRLSFWKDLDMPQLKGRVEITETKPDIFYRTFFSNHFKWENDFYKEKRFLLGGSLEIPKWSAEVGYNLMHIRDYLFFNEDGVPDQTSDLTVTSAYGQLNLRFLRGFNFFNRVVWQANTNSSVLSLPNFIVFSSLFYEAVIVPNALTAQLGANVTYRSRFFADAYNPATGQFYNQRVMELGDYPTIDVFANFKWKRSIIFVKYEHLNQGYPHSRYFSAFSYPLNPQIFKFGVSWIFYD